MTAGRASALVLAVVVGMATPAVAQTRSAAQTPQPAGRAKEFSVGATWFGPVSMGTASADLLTPSGSTLPLFVTENSLGSGLGVSAGFGFALSRSVWAEVVGGWSLAKLRTDVTYDAEDADIEPIRSTVNRLTLEGAALWYFKAGRATGWFLRGGAAWVTELPEGNALAENGFAVNATVGVRHWWRQDARGRKRTGFRALGGLDMRSGGLTLGEDSVRFAPMASFSLLFGF